MDKPFPDQCNLLAPGAADLRSRFIALMDLLSALRRLLASSDTLNSEAEVVQCALSELATHMHLGACSVFLCDGDELVCVAGTGMEEELNRALGRGPQSMPCTEGATRFKIGEGLMGRTCESGEVHSSTDCANDPRFKEFEGLSQAQRPGSLISVPLTESGEVSGVLNVSHAQPGFFDNWHQNALHLFAESLAQLLRNFRLLKNLDQKVASRTGALQQALVEAERLRERFEHLAVMDELTGLHNRRYFFREAPRVVAAAQREKMSISMVIADLDEFKKINDTWGHTYGDTVLVRTAEVLETELRAGDLLARLGGEEFVLLLPHTDPQGALHLTSRINSRLPSLPVGDDGQTYKLTASFGIVELTPDMARVPSTDALGLMYARADKAMYKSKTKGRRCATLFSDDLE